MEGFVFNRAIAQLVARDVRDVEVAGSNPVCPTIKKKRRIFLEIRLFYAENVFFCSGKQPFGKIPTARLPVQ